MNHLTQQELERWRDEGRAEDRDRVLAHIAECDDCRRALAALVRRAEPTPAPSRLDPAAFVGAGYAAHRQPTRAWHYDRRMLLATAGAIAAVLLLAIVVPGPWHGAAPGSETSAVTRSGDFRLISPIGATRAPFDFEWSSPVAADRYRLLVSDAAGSFIESYVGKDERAPLSTALRDRLKPGVDYSWKVEALDKEGGVITQSPPAVFTIEN